MKKMPVLRLNPNMLGARTKCKMPAIAVVAVAAA
jgi:hypothetical protein